MEICQNHSDKILTFWILWPMRAFGESGVLSLIQDFERFFCLAVVRPFLKLKYSFKWPDEAEPTTVRIYTSYQVLSA